MVELEWETTRASGQTLVAAIVTNTQTTPQRVRLATCLEGPTWPPRRDGRTAPEWTDGTWEAVIDPGHRRGIGFASDGPPAEPPLELVSADRAEPDRSPPRENVLASLPAWAPTAAVLEER